MPGWAWDPLEEEFLNGLERLRAFADREGHARVPQRYKDETGFKLGNWVINRRTKYKKGDLPPERIKALEEVPGWVWDPLEGEFLNGLERLRAFADREGHARVLRRYKDETGFKLGTWVSRQRMEYRKGDLSPERIKALEEVPGWAWDPVEEEFQNGLERLRAFADRECHARVRSTYTDETGFKLGPWVGNRRNEYRKGDLSPERIKALEEVVGWTWDAFEEEFQNGLERLRAFADREGHARVPHTYKDETGFKLGKWVGSRRNEYRKGDLSPERIKALEEVAGWAWDAFEEEFQNGLERLRAFADPEGHARVPYGYKDETGFKLGRWVGSRRNEYRKGDLSPERIKVLEEVAGWAWVARS